MLNVTPHHTPEALEVLAKLEPQAAVTARLRAVVLAMRELSCGEIA